MKNRSVFCIITAGILLAMCNHEQDKEQKSGIPDEFITITRMQFETGKMVIGEPCKIPFDEKVRCNGNILVEPSGAAIISTSVPGLVKKINCTTGQKVNAGQILFELSGNEFIELQKDFAEMSSQLTRIKSEYERVKSLYGEKIGTEKEMILAESDFKTANAKYSALKMKLKIIGLNDTKIEDGNFYEYFSLKSPLDGYISRINVSIGQYTDQQTVIAEIFDITKLQLRIAVFEKDLGKLEENQQITFNLLGSTQKSYSSRLKTIGKNVDDESKTIICYADIDDPKSAIFVNNAYVEAAITTRIDTVTAVPEESVVKSGGNNYLLAFVKNENDNYFLKRVKVDIGRLNNGFVEILNQPDITRIITKGAYNIRIEQ
jgi:membrane fusion protein, heavy metal efflux system